jgi:hypothetical protein
MRWIPFFPTKRHLIRLAAFGTFSSRRRLVWAAKPVG